MEHLRDLDVYVQNSIKSPPGFAQGGVLPHTERFISRCVPSFNEKLITSIKENKMAVNTNAIINLAAASGNDEFSKYDQLPDNLKQALKRKMKEREGKAADEAADAIMQLLDLAESTIKDRVALIRDFRSRVEETKVSIGKVELAKAYGMKTQNFMPLAKALGYHFNSEYAERLVIPADFKAKG